MTSTEGPVPFHTFAAAIANYFEIQELLLDGETLLVEDLGFDSIMYLEIVCLLEDVAGRPIDDGLVASLRTVGDLHHFYISLKPR